jgi:fatty-acyl-CoA synthase
VEYNLAQVLEVVETACASRPAIVFQDRHLSYGELGRRTRRLANVLAAHGLGARTERSALDPHRSGQDHVGVLLHNGNEYLEAMIGSFKARVAPFNVNFRYVAEELESLLRAASARGLVYHSTFAPVVERVRSALGGDLLLLQVADRSGRGLLDGARWYEDALVEASEVIDPALREAWSPDDLYLLFTGGTTGRPKGVLWRQADIFVAAMGGRRADNQAEWASPDDIAAMASLGGAKLLPAAPLMHGAAQWLAFSCFTAGNTLVLPSVVDHFDPDDVLRTVEEHRVNIMLVVGDAFARPLVDALEGGEYDVSSLLALVSGGATLSAGVKNELLDRMPSMMILDGLGASETGAQGSSTVAAGQVAVSGRFQPGRDTCVLAADLSGPASPDDSEPGWLGQRGHVPLGYLDDAESSARTFPVIAGVRYSVPGDRARTAADGTIELLGRDAVTINTGGEKVFAEEVERALAGHAAVRDVVVCGRSSEVWGEEVVAIVELRADAVVSDDELLAEAARHVARYKLPKSIIRHPGIERSPSGKADYRWARGVVADATIPHLDRPRRKT